jgi:hypothetical protein
MKDELIGEYVARASGSVGCEILDPGGEVVAWTVDGWWAATIVALLNGAESHGPGCPVAKRVEDAKEPLPVSGVTVGEAGNPPEDLEPTAREAISHLAYNGLAIRWEIPGGPSEAVRNMVEPYLGDPEMVETLSDLATKYTMKRLADDHLGLGALVLPEETGRRDDNRMRSTRTETGSDCETRAPDSRYP